MSIGRSATQYEGVLAKNPPNVIYAERNPVNGTDKAFVKGDLWLNTLGLASFQFSGVSWIELGTGIVGDIATLTGDSGGAIAPVGANIDILGDAVDGVSVVGTAGTLTINVAQATTTARGTLETSTDAESVTGTSILVAVTPASLTARLAAPGAIGGTTPAAGTFTDLTAVGTVSINASGAGVTTIGTGGTGATNIGNATGNTAVTGSLTTTTSITATLGDITATNGNIVRGTAGNKDVYSSVASTTTAGANSAGTVTLAGGTATISTTAVTASSQIRLYRQGIGATGAAALGIITLGTVVAATSFVINAVQAADATALQASDVSVIGWEIVN